jgi:hypothetical protein
MTTPKANVQMDVRAKSELFCFILFGFLLRWARLRQAAPIQFCKFERVVAAVGSG